MTTVLALILGVVIVLGAAFVMAIYRARRRKIRAPQDVYPLW